MAESSTTGGNGGGVDEGTALRLTRQQLSIIGTNATRGRPLSPDEREKSITCIMAIINDKGSSRRTKITAAKALAALEALDLRDLHHTERLQHESGILDLRMRRAEEGKPNDSVLVQVSPSEVLPLPPALAEYRRKMMEPSKS